MITSKRNLIDIPAGVDKDSNAYSTFQWTDADKIRFNRGYPQKIGGWHSIEYNNAQTLEGVPRSIWSYFDANGLEHMLIGTDTRLYSYESGKLYNITPLVTSTTAIANSLSTTYGVFNNNPITTTVDTKTITVAVAPFAIGLFQVGDFIRITGTAGAVGGIAAANIDGTYAISSVTATTITYQSGSATPATSTATGGGAAVNLATRIVSVAQVAHGFSNGDRVKILAAAAFGGFAVGDLNIEAVIRDVSANAYTYYSTAADTSGNFSTSSAAAGGGAATTVQGQIAAGVCEYNTGLGYGGGAYGAGTYGTPKVFTSGYFAPRIWSFDKFDTGVVLTPGNQSGLYLWAGSVDTAPELQTAGSCPSAINYVAVMNDQIVVFGSGGAVNAITSTSDITNWTVDPAITFFNETIKSAGRLIASEYCKGQYVIFTENSVHKMTFVGSPDIWVVDDVMLSDGLMGPQASTFIQDNVVWLGQENFYIYNGSIVNIIPNNTLCEWFFSQVNTAKFYHAFAHKSVVFDEIWWFAPFGGAEEPDNYVIWNWAEGHFTNGQLSRTASEDPNNANRSQYMAYGDCSSGDDAVLYVHETKEDYSDDGGNMSGSLTSNYNIIDTGEYMQQILRIIPSTSLMPFGDSQTGALLCNMTIYTKEYDGQQFPRTFGSYPIYDTTQKIEVRANGRQRQYKFEFDNTTGFRLEKFFEELRTTTPR